MALATLTIDINARLANIEADMGKLAHLSEQSAQRMTKAFDTAKTALLGLAGTLGVGLSAGALVAFVKGSIDAADSLNDLSQSVGISIKDLATWTLAANQSGTSLESVARGVKGLSTFMVANSEEMKKAGITATDANGALIQLADLFKALPDGVEKSALAVKLFGKAGLEMIPLLNQGSEGLTEAAKASKLYGERMAVLAPLADKFNDQLATMALQSKVFGINLAIGILPTLTRFAEQLQAGKEIAGGWVSAMWEFGVLLDPTKGIVGNLNETRVALERLHAEMAKGMAQNLADGGQTDLSDIGSNIALGERRKKYLEFLQRQSVMENAAKLGDYRDARDLSQAPDTLAAMKAAKEILAAEKAAKAVKTPKIGGFTDYEAKINEAVAGAIQGSAVVKARELADQIERLDKLFFDSGLDAEVYTSALQKLTGMTAAVGKESERLNQLLDATPTAKLEEARADMQLLAKAFEDGKISEEQFSEAALTRIGQLGKAMQDTDNFARDMGLTFASAFEDAVIGGKKFSDVLVGLEKDIARIVLRKTVTEPLGNTITDVIKTGDFGNFFSRIFGGGRASGGSVDPSKIYLVGERGPELFAPSSSGAILPRPAMGGGGITVNIVEDRSRAGQTQARQSSGGGNILDVFVEQVRATVASDIARGSGPIPAAMSMTYGLNRAAGAY